MKLSVVIPCYNEAQTIETVIDAGEVRGLIPKLLKEGAEGIIEYPLNKVV